MTKCGARSQGGGQGSLGRTCEVSGSQCALHSVCHPLCHRKQPPRKAAAFQPTLIPDHVPHHMPVGSPARKGFVEKTTESDIRERKSEQKGTGRGRKQKALPNWEPRWKLRHRKKQEGDSAESWWAAHGGHTRGAWSGGSCGWAGNPTLQEAIRVPKTEQKPRTTTCSQT